MATDIHTACTRGRRGLQTAAALTVFFFSAAQASAQAPPTAPVPPTAPAPTSSAPPSSPAPTPTRATPPTPAKPVPTPDARGLGDEVPQSVEAPPSPEPPPTEPPPTDVTGTPPVPETPPSEPSPVADPVVAPPPTPPTPPPGPANNDGSLLVKDQQQAEDLRRKGLGVLITGGVITLVGAATSIAFTIRGTQYERLLVDTEEEYNRSNCSSKAMIAEASKCDLLGKQRARNIEGIEFGDRATRAAGAAIAAGVVVTVVGGIIYRLGVNKLRSGNVSRVQMQPSFGRNFNGVVLTGRF